MNTAVYVIENAATGRCYIGGSIDIKTRRRWHFNALRRGQHHSAAMQRDYAEHGADALQFRVLLWCDGSTLRMYEQRAIDTYRPEYNVCPTAGTRKGAKYTDEARARLAALRKAQPRSPAQLAHLAKITEANRGRTKVISAEQRAKISATLTGRKQAPETTAKIAASMRGRRHTEETRQKMSEAKYLYWEQWRAARGS